MLLPGYRDTPFVSLDRSGREGGGAAGGNKTSAFSSDRKWRRGRTWWIKSMKAIQTSAPFSRSVIAENVKIGRNDSPLDLGCWGKKLGSIVFSSSTTMVSLLLERRDRSPLRVSSFFFSPIPRFTHFPLVSSNHLQDSATQFLARGISDHNG